MLKIYDPPPPHPTASYSVTSCFILVEGQFIIGSRQKQFRSKIRFVLAPNPWKRQPWTAWFSPPADRLNPRVMGHKAFAVMGGYVDFHGMPGGPDTPSWVKLAATARAGQKSILVDRDVSRTWPAGGKIAIASTGWFYWEAENFIIRKLQKHPRGTILHLDKPLKWLHYGDAKGVPDGFGGFIDERAEVALLTRNIVITGVDEPGQYRLEGGHFIVFMTQTPQSLEGVEFFRMGQQGVLGRYNIHLHVCGNTRGRFLIRKNAMHDSKQRCVVVHATHNVTIDSNVAYNTSGHCYILEEGGEQDNTFIHNLGFATRKPEQKIMDGPVAGSSSETDDTTSTFWISNVQNRFIGNVAAGSFDNGFWMELRNEVRGMSAYIPSLASIAPRNGNLLLFKDNVAHSNLDIGLRLYPFGVSSPGGWTDYGGRRGTIYNMVLYKHRNLGALIHQTKGIYLDGARLADNRYGVEISGSQGVGVVNSCFVGSSNNIDSLGQPDDCKGPEGPKNCAPIRGCKYNESDLGNLKMTGGNPWLGPLFGIIMDQPGTGSDGLGAHNFTGSKFSRFDRTCGRFAAAIAVAMEDMVVGQNEAQWWNAGQYLKGLKFGRGVTPLWFPPKRYNFPYRPEPMTMGVVTSNFAMWDRDGSIVGGRGGFILGVDPSLRPVAKKYKCQPMAAGHAIKCPGTCYRSLRIFYDEPGFQLRNRGDRLRRRGDFSHITIRRWVDGVVKTTDGNLNSYTFQSTGHREFRENLLAGESYVVSVRPPKKNTSFTPESISISFIDGGGCGEGLTLHLLPMRGEQWTGPKSAVQIWSPCSGATLSRSFPVQQSVQCVIKLPALKVVLTGDATAEGVFTLVPQQKDCKLNRRCSVYADSDWYFYDTSGRELHSPRPGAMGFQAPGYPQRGWKRGQAIIGNASYPWDGIKSLTPAYSNKQITFYYRRTFTLAQSKCFSGIILDFFQLSGLVGYLNGVEFFRFDMPRGKITNSTLALSQYLWPASNMWRGFFNSSYIRLASTKASLVDGTNHVAFESHAVWAGQTYTFFDTRMELIRTSAACTQQASKMIG